CHARALRCDLDRHVARLDGLHGHVAGRVPDALRPVRQDPLPRAERRAPGGDSGCGGRGAGVCRGETAARARSARKRGGAGAGQLQLPAGPPGAARGEPGSARGRDAGAGGSDGGGQEHAGLADPAAVRPVRGVRAGGRVRPAGSDAAQRARAGLGGAAGAAAAAALGGREHRLRASRCGTSGGGGGGAGRQRGGVHREAARGLPDGAGGARCHALLGTAAAAGDRAGAAARRADPDPGRAHQRAGHADRGRGARGAGAAARRAHHVRDRAPALDRARCGPGGGARGGGAGGAGHARGAAARGGTLRTLPPVALGGCPRRRSRRVNAWWLRLARDALGPVGGLPTITALTLVGVALQAVRPWPITLLVDHVLVTGELREDARWLMWLPGASSTRWLVAWLAGATVLVAVARSLADRTLAWVKVGVGNR